MDLPKASDASNLSTLNEALKVVESILEAINSGNGAIFLNYHITEATAKYLRDSGYKVKLKQGRAAYGTLIEWR